MLLLPAKVSVRDAVATQGLLLEALKRETGQEVIVDASELRQFDSAVLAVLLACERLAKAAGKAFVVRGMPPKLASLATLYGIDSLLQREAVSLSP